MRGGVTALLVLACLLPAMPAAAGTIWRCDGPDGAISYVNKKVAGAKCTAVSHYKSTPAPARTPAPAPAAASTAATVSSSAEAVPGAQMTNAAPPSGAKSGSGTRLVQGQVYSYIKDGVRHYTSAPPPKGAAGQVRTIRYSFLETCYACAASGPDFGTVRLNTTAYSAEIAAAARKYGVDEAVVRAIIHAESAFNPNALSRVGAQGLMQLMPATARRFGVDNPFDAGQNIHGGVEYLAWLLKRFNGNLTLAAAGYNAGEGNVDKYDGVPPFSETQRYVQRVGLLAERYRDAITAG
ncbi:lytic transglycosylase domain-containing protein [Lysobacter sp. GX 14042]|uniref:lytic transglycosylase domain-containing protein n=1 Tax=Lysobacter sp. GX 14042 TaxID=2907155 RepID=UPI001F24BF55|nr:lytic transglycosylase domain-containing protein [Lysobacter sp. GX 14042]MCE7031802.1 lytic transglycosylase domain-containing protein [Lysobacter sp. GX 14042]